jgi:hypothetical protein
MTDREKVIKALECYCESNSFDRPNCKDCPAGCMLGYMSIPFIQQVLALLKEQEAVKPIPPTDESDLWKCGNCNHQLFRCTQQRYCEMCGRSVKWE